jgi:hypothetical protein
MKILARILQGVGLLAILAAGAGLVVLFELDFLVGDYLLAFIIGIVGGIVGGVILIAISAVVAPGSAKVSFPMFRPSRSIDGVDPEPISADPEDKP